MTISRRAFVFGIPRLGLVGGLLASCDEKQAPAQTSPEVLKEWKRGERLTRIKDSSLSQDGRYGVFSRLDTEECSIALVDFETAKTVSFAFGPEFAKVEDAAISSDGSKIAITLYNKPAGPDGSGGYGQSEIWVLDRTGAVEFKLVGLNRMKKMPQFSPDCEKLIFFADMRHQYLEPDELRLVVDGLGSFAVHELNFKDREIRLIDLPILPIPRGTFYTNSDTIIAAWSENVEDPEFDRLPADCVCGHPKSGDYGGNFWQRIRPRFEQTVGETRLLDGNTSRFQKFQMILPKFASVRDTLWLTNSACENGFLALLTLYDPNQDPSPSLLKYPNYQPPDASTRVISWLTRDGARADLDVPNHFDGILGASGSYNKTRVMAWAGGVDMEAPEFLFPWTYTAASGWEFLDLKTKYILKQMFDVKIDTTSIIVEIPQLIDKNGVGGTYETKSPVYGVRRSRQ
jgi:hypothetical protein